jgi:hypothetical protein
MQEKVNATGQNEAELTAARWQGQERLEKF